MDPKKALSFFIMALFVLSPILVACSDAEADTNAGKSGNAILVTADDVSYSEAVSVFRIQIRDVTGIFCDGITVNDTLFDVSVEISNAHLSTGIKRSFVDGEYVQDRVMEKVFDFKFTLTMKTAGQPFTVGDTGPTSGEGVDELRKVLSKSLDAGDTITLTGHKSNKSVQRQIVQYYHNESLGYLATYKAVEPPFTVFTMSDADCNAKMIYNGRTIEAVEKAKMSILAGKEYDFGGKDVRDVKEGDRVTLVTKDIDFKVLKTSQGIAIDGVDKHVTVDNEKFKDAVKKQVKPGERVTEKATFVKIVNTGVFCTELAGLSHKYESMYDLTTAVNRIGGTVSTDVGDFDRELDDVTKNLNSSNETSMFIPAIVVLAVIVFIIAALIWYYAYWHWYW